MRRAVRGAAALAILTGALAVALAVPGGTARAADCWLLDPPALERARAEGRCQDVFARNAPPTGSTAAKPAPTKPTAGKPAPARPAKATRRAPAKAAPQPALAASLDRLFGRYKPARGSMGRAPGGGIDHLAYGRAERNPVQR